MPSNTPSCPLVVAAEDGRRKRAATEGKEGCRRGHGMAQGREERIQTGLLQGRREEARRDKDNTGEVQQGTGYNFILDRF